MREKPRLRALSDDELLRSLSEVLKTSRRVEADLVAHIGEVDARKLYRREATPSMFVYCTQRLHLSEPEAALRIRVARAARKHSVLLRMLRHGQIHLSGIALLAPLLTRENRDRLLKRARYKSKREIQELVAELAPQPDLPTAVRRLPARPASLAAPSGLLQRPETAASVTLCPPVTSDPEQRPDAVADPDGEALGGPGMCANAGQRPDAVPPPPRPATIQPLAPARFKVQFTASAELRDKLERLQALMRRSRPDVDLAAIIDTAVTEKLERLEAKRFGKTKKPRKGPDEADTTPKSRHIPAPLRRAVDERDGGQCTYTDDQGRRCPERDDLEFHHDGTPFGKNGDHSPDNIRLMCPAHNQLRAEEEYGEEVMARFRRSASGVSEPAVVYAVRTPPRVQGGSPG